MTEVKRRQHGTGSILSRGGRFTARVRLHGKLKQIGTCDTREEAERLLSAANARLGELDEDLSNGLTLNQWADKCLVKRELGGFADSYNDQNRYSTHIRSHWLGKTSLKAISTSDVRSWLREMLTKRSRARKSTSILTRDTVRRYLSLLCVFLQMAVDDEQIERNPARDVKLPPQSRSQDEDDDENRKYLSSETQAAFLAHPDIHEADKLRVFFAVYTGLRQGEQRCLELRDVHLEDDNPHIYVRWGSPGRPPKHGRRRTVPLLPEAVRLMKQWLTLLPSYAKQNPMKLVWPLPSGCRRQKSKHYGLKEQLGLAGYTEPFRWHDLRHTCASSLISGLWGRRWSLEEIAKVLGHKDVTTTQIYAHLAVSVIQNAARETPGLAIARRDPNAIQQHLSTSVHLGSTRTTEPEVARSNRAGRTE